MGAKTLTIAAILRTVAIAFWALAAQHRTARATSGALPLPAPGSYKLDKIQGVPLSVVREGGGASPHLLSTYTSGKITLLTFFYGYCRDPNGCPLAWSAFEAVRRRVNTDAALSGKVRLVFVTFDPARDTPETLRLFAEAYNSDQNATRWHFLTTGNLWMLRRTLAQFGQDISVERIGGDGKDVVINHMLKVFLIDRSGWVREIYTSGFLNVDAIMGDIKTLQIEEADGRVR